jgi:hypothetical protein
MEVYVVYYEDLIGCTEIYLFSTREKAQKWIDRQLEKNPEREGDYDIGIHYIDDEDME